MLELTRLRSGEIWAGWLDESACQEMKKKAEGISDLELAKIFLALLAVIRANHPPAVDDDVISLSRPVLDQDYPGHRLASTTSNPVLATPLLLTAGTGIISLRVKCAVISRHQAYPTRTPHRTRGRHCNHQPLITNWAVPLERAGSILRNTPYAVHRWLGSRRIFVEPGQVGRS
jgi:hypothetical protein